MSTRLKLSVLTILIAVSCGKKKSDDEDTTSSTPVVANLSTVPDAGAFIATSKGPGLIGGSGDVTVGTPPLFADVSKDVKTELTGDYSSLLTQIEANRAANKWTDMKPQFDTFFAGQSKCQLMEATARIVSRLSEDTGTLCVLKALGAKGPSVFQVVSGTPMADLSTVFGATATTKILKISTPGDDSGASNVMFQILGTTDATNKGFSLTLTMCDATNKPTQQNIVTIDNSTGAMVFNSKRLDKENGNTRAANFTLSGTLVSDGNGGAIPDLTKPRMVTYANQGTFGSMASSNQGSLTITPQSVLNAIFMQTNSGTDPNGNAMNNLQKNVISVSYSGTKLSNIVIKEGAGADLSTFNGKFGDGNNGSNTHTGSIAFNFDNTKIPMYTTQTASDFLTTVNAVNMATDPILKQSAPAAPDTTMDANACTAAPTTVLKMTAGAKPIMDSVMGSCNDNSHKNNGNLCEGLRNAQQTVNNAVFFRFNATGKKDNQL